MAKLLEELGKEYEDLISAFLHIPQDYEAVCLYNAIKDKDDFVDTVISIIATSSLKVNQT